MADIEKEGGPSMSLSNGVRRGKVCFLFDIAMLCRISIIFRSIIADQAAVGT